MRAVEDLRAQAEEQLSRIKEMELRIADFKERNSTVSVERSSDIDNQQLISLNARVETDKQIYDEIRTKMDLIAQSREDGTPLWELNFIAVFPGVNELQSRLRLITIEIAQLSETYGPRHPRMIAARQSLTQAERELRDLVETAAISFRNDYNRARANFQNSRNRLEQQKQELIAIDRIRPEFNALMRDLEVSRQLYDHYLSRLQQASAMVAIDTQNARIIDSAAPPNRPYKPNIPMNLAIGLFMGVGLGFGLVFMLAILDDKVKTAFDIEASIGLPLIGIIPRISRVDPVEKARIVADNLDKHTVEAFRSIHSTLKLNEESRNAKVILTTSTIPSEGKSFISTNLGITFAGHGERTIIVDCDLRMPNVGKSLDLPESKGMLNYFAGEAELNDVIVKDFVPGMDVLPTGGRSKNATQVLTSSQFEELIHDLRLRYDKIVIDSPPLAPVSDALNILPLADGVVYVIRFNMVKRKTVNLNLRRLRESNVPVFGAILNNINASVAGYYYSDYYDRSYRHYYMQDSLNSEETPIKVPSKSRKRQIEGVPLEKV
ncbi:MAG: polysaccharide biosynthesis tyrosine autokinase [Verrucomicrobia bacterium]|nr:polysaccharide biosynthesis tyrosine autokinase [Verrucomicrobiota bacterium]